MTFLTLLVEAFNADKTIVRKDDSMTESPIISVIIPTFNKCKYMEQTIKSVLDQKVPLEIIIIDDCSIDSLDEVINKYLNLPNITYIKNNINLGVAKSRNIGVNIAKGKYIAYLDADDWWQPTKLEKQLKIMEANQYALCYTGRELVKSDGSKTNKIIPVKKIIDYNGLLRHNCISCSSVLLPANIAKDIPMSNDEFHEDFINWLRILKKYGQAYGINEPLLVYRESENGKSRNHLKSARMTYGVYRVIKIGVLKSFMLTFSHLLHAIIKHQFNKNM